MFVEISIKPIKHSICETANINFIYYKIDAKMKSLRRKE